MADAVTTNFSWSYPTNGADASTWGTTLNTTVIAIDAQCALFALKASPTFTGTVAGVNGYFTGYGSFGGTIGATGAATFGSTLAVAGTSTLGGSLAVAGTANVSGLLSAGTGISLTGNVFGVSTAGGISFGANPSGSITAGAIITLYGSTSALPGAISFGNNNLERVHIDNAGNVGIGMTAVRLLDVAGTFGSAGAATLGSTLSVAGASSLAAVTVAGAAVFSGAVTKGSAGGVPYMAATGDIGGAITISTLAPTGTPANGDLWLQHA